MIRAAWRGRRGARRPSARSTASAASSAPTRRRSTSVRRCTPSPVFAEARPPPGPRRRADHRRRRRRRRRRAARRPARPRPVARADRRRPRRAAARPAGRHRRGSTEVPATAGALLVANEWLDDVPVDVVELTDDGWRLVLVDPATGAERLGPPAGRRRRRLAGDVVAGEDAASRRPGRGRPAARRGLGRRGRQPHRRAGRRDRLRARPRVAPAGRQPHRLPRRPPGAAGARRQLRRHQPRRAGRLRRSRHRRPARPRRCSPPSGAALTALGVRRDAPPYDLSRTDPAGYLRALSRAGEAAELTDPDGLGGFGWLLQARGLRQVPLDAARPPTPPATGAGGG